MTVAVRQTLRHRASGLTARQVTTEVLRGLTAAGVLLSADVHLQLWAQGYRHIPVIGPLFVLNVAGGLLIALVLLVWRHPLSALAAVGFGAATLAAFLISVTVGLFGVQENLSGIPQQLAGAAEIVVICCGAALVVVQSMRHSRDR